MAVSGLPSGTVTFLFSDIESSTALLTKLGRDRYEGLLAEHDRLLRSAVAAHDGRVVDTQGDSFFVAFRTAADAVAAAVDAQRDLDAHEWLDGTNLRVRMGVHTGEPKLGEQRYVGIDVHRAARIGAVGHGGQVLLSSTTKELAEDELPFGVSIRDLGERRLKDIDQPQRIYQLVIDGLQGEFAQLRTLDVELARRRRRMYAGAALIGVLAAAVAIPVFALAQRGSSGDTTVEGNAVAEIDPASGEVVGQVPNVGARPGPIAYGSGSLWVATLDDQTVVRIDPGARSIQRTFRVQDVPTGLAASAGAVWVVGAARSSVRVLRIDPRFDTVSRGASIGNVVPGGPGSVAARGSTVWVAPSAGLVSRLDPTDGRVEARIDPNSGPTAIALGADAIWLTGGDANTVTRIDTTGVLTPIPVGHGPNSIAVGEGGVWVAVAKDDAVVRIDPFTRAVTDTIPVGRAPAAVTVGEGAVWVANAGDGTVTRIDPSDTALTSTIEVGGSPQGIVVAGGRVWVTVATQAVSPEVSGNPGGVVRVQSSDDVDNMDPALAWFPMSWQFLYATCAKLVNYPDRAGPEGSQLVPEVAESLPARSEDGTTYSFRIRKGFRFSPPSNQSVTAQTFKYAIERSLSPEMKGGGQYYLGDVVGAEAFIAGKASGISGVVAKGNTLSIRLVAPAPDLPTRLALPFFCAVPVGTPRDPKGVRTIPSAGPYYVSSYVPKQVVVLTRNPNYEGGRPRRPDTIQLSVGVAKRKIDSGVEASSVDYNISGVDPADEAGVAARYGPGSPAARNGRQRYFVNPQLSLNYILLNTHRPLFADARLRRAVNLAIDRAALARVGRSRPTDQYLPPGMPGFEDARVYSLTPDVTRARSLAGTKHRAAVLYTCQESPCDRLAQTIKTNLAAIGIDVTIEAFPAQEQMARLGRAGEPFDLAVGGYIGWFADFPDPGNFLNFLVGTGAGGVTPAFTDPGYQRKVQAASRLSGPPRYLAYGELDAYTSRVYAPWVPFGNTVARDFFSARMGCQVVSPVYGVDLAALCIEG